MSVFLRFAVVCLVLALPASSRALTPEYNIAQYGHRIWRVGDSGLEHQPTAVTQAKTGQLWIGTSGGVYQFDGERFTHFETRVNPTINSANVYDIMDAGGNNVYATYPYHLMELPSGRSPPYTNTTPYLILANDRSGKLWAARVAAYGDGDLCSVMQNSLKCYSGADGLQCSHIESITTDKNLNIWLGGASGVCRWRPGAGTRRYALGDSKSPVTGLAFDVEDTLWAAVSGGAARSGLFYLKNNNWTQFRSGGLNWGRLGIAELVFDRDGGLWLGTRDRGLYHIYRGRIDHIDQAGGLSGDNVSYIYEDHEGSIWVATSHGLDQFFSQSITPFTASEHLGESGTFWLSPASAGAMIVSGARMLQRFSPTFGFTTLASYATRSYVSTIFYDSQGRLWKEEGARISVSKGQSTRVLQIGGEQEAEVVYAFGEDRDHNVWLGGRDPKHPTQAALFCVDHNLQIHRLSLPKQARSGFISGLASDTAGGMWLAVFNNGFYHLHEGQVERLDALGRSEATKAQILPVTAGEAWFLTDRGAEWLKDGHVRVLDTRSGLPCDGLYGLTADRFAGLWLTSSCGLVNVTAPELRKWRQESGYRVRSRVIGSSDGYFGDAKSRLVMADTGTLWFSAGGGIYEVDPARMTSNPLAPPVEIQAIMADRQPFGSAAKVVLPKLTRDLEIDYAGLSYRQPGLLRFRYRLFGHDNSWNEVGDRRQAVYNDLPPGRYRFQVTACNKDGVCNNRGASTTIVIPPAWWQTWWFRALCALGALALVGWAIRWRLNVNAEQMRLRFRARLQERTQVARDLHDTLMQTVLASKMLADGSRDIDSLPKGRAAFIQLSGWLERAVEEGRMAVNALRSSGSDDRNLVEAFELVASETCVGLEIEVPILVTGEVRDLHPVVREQVHRIGVEAIRNACVHSGASHVIVSLNYGRNFALGVSDDGRGIDEEVLLRGKAGHFGLVGLRERADRISAELTLASSSMGTAVTLVVPGAVAFTASSGLGGMLLRFRLETWGRLRRALSVWLPWS